MMRPWVAALAVVAVGLAACTGSSPSGTQRPDSSAARYLRAKELNQKALEAQKDGKTDKAIGLYREAVQVEPRLFMAWNNLGVLYMEKQNYVEAGLALKSAADLAPTDPVPVENLALAYYRAGYADKALEFYLQAIDRAPNRPDGYRGAYQSSERLGLKDKAALQRVQKALLVETDPKWRGIYERKRVWLVNEPGNEDALK